MHKTGTFTQTPRKGVHINNVVRKGNVRQPGNRDCARINMIVLVRCFFCIDNTISYPKTHRSWMKSLSKVYTQPSGLCTILAGDAPEKEAQYNRVTPYLVSGIPVLSGCMSKRRITCMPEVGREDVH